jgi:hypothetical protein
VPLIPLAIAIPQAILGIVRGVARYRHQRHNQLLQLTADARDRV